MSVLIRDNNSRPLVVRRITQIGTRAVRVCQGTGRQRTLARSLAPEVPEYQIDRSYSSARRLSSRPPVSSNECRSPLAKSIFVLYRAFDASLEDGLVAPSSGIEEQQHEAHRVLNSASHPSHQDHHFQTSQHMQAPYFDQLAAPQMDQPQLPQASALVQAGASAPTVSTSAGKVRTVNPGDRVNIPCSLATMGGSIQFAKDDQPIILDAGCAHCQLDISNDGSASLTINRVSQRDQGHWQCWRLDAAGKVKQKMPVVQLVVTNSPELPILFVNDRELIGGNNLDAQITVKENEDVNFKCVIKGASTPVEYVHWILDSNTNVTHKSQLMMEYSTQENNYLTQSVLKLNATKSMNLKSISCLSYHQLWLTPMTVTALLNVLYEPSFTISREPGFGVPVTEGMTVILKCEIDSNPISQPVWIKDADNKTAAAANNALSGGQDPQQQQQQQFTGKESLAEPIVLDTQEDGSVVFQPARRQDSGWYRCKTENKYGNFSSFGYYLNVRAAGAQVPAASNQQQQQQPVRPRSDQPRIMSPNQPAAQVGGPNFNQPASMQPTVRPIYDDNSNYLTGNNAIQRSQLANDQPARGSNSNGGGGGYGAQQTASSDERCKSVQPGRIDGAPEIKNPVSTVQAVLGRQLILPLRFCCNPAPLRVFWIHRHLAMIPGRMFGPYITRDVHATYDSFYCYHTTFEIEQVKPEDIGTVYVFVGNEKGHAGAQINIQLAKQQPDGASPHPFRSPVNTIGSRFPLLNGGFPSSSAGESPGSSSTTAHWILMTMLAATTIIIQLNHLTSCHILPDHHHQHHHHRSTSSSFVANTCRDEESTSANDQEETRHWRPPMRGVYDQDYR